MIFYSEKKLAAAMGLPRADLRAARETTLKKEEHFLAAPGKEVALTEAGLGRLLDYWAATTGPVKIGPEQLEAAKIADLQPAEPIKLRVTRVFRNRKLIEARFAEGPADARRVQVSVPNNKNFVPNAPIMGRPKAPGSTAYELVGRCPKRKGRF